MTFAVRAGEIWELLIRTRKMEENKEDRRSQEAQVN